MRAFCLPPVWRGSTYVPRPTCVTRPGRPAAISRISCDEHALRERVRLELVRLDERAEARLVADVAADRPPHEPGQAELREAAIGEVADADDADRRQVARPALRREHRGELVDEPLRQGVPGAGAADDDRAPSRTRPTASRTLTIPFMACTPRRSG